MSSGDITRYVITVTFHEDSLTEFNELNNHLTRSGFLLTLTDDEGSVHELGTNTFGFISSQSADEIKALVTGLAKSALDKDVDITVTTWEEWSKNAQ
ncbi:type V toxin-antitoxin system endoribonuclease antitoxin GhoS [Salmonella enterica]|nr:endoribonuclease GhoS [Salmonella enterica]EBQ4288318.1 type V toxin-antitoxin system endoribonuclease antitoxin GhoS [Salmonella enterica]EBQ4482272.1 type V toxin-antitoxin system endoribonuclease antitoxin GhoS [Salmonella enterica]EBQ4499795.1 type V toxin-antitoxin system endoribonuclease antitoxin GhoS [Salmonella enterica]ECC2506085.1 type V toxin-antitoxin system endoribonuclease antitoxin GhoS [Salmonella enterica]